MSDRELLELEITMHAFRMMRDGGYRRATKLWEDLQKDFLDVPKDRLKQVVAALCRKLMEEE